MADKIFRKGPHAAKNKVVDVEAVPVSDERKTVILDENLEGVEFDDKVWLYWTRNKKSIIFSVVLAFAIIVGVQSYKLYKQYSAKALSDVYLAAQTSAELENFAKEHAGTNLAGVANLQNADSLYKANNYAQAKLAYSKAAKDLSSTVLYGRALLGEAVCQYALDKTHGIKSLETVYAQQSIEPAYKAQAGYLLGLAYRTQGKSAEARKILESVAQSPQSGYFAYLAQQALMSL